ncbi:N-acetylgalactosaminide beta-1,3-galactosyltransferase [Aphelenchoides besseyi]|nr:N-acetylgalactosaminide beta-1,3-galactosyltransferase [Aphelenchoides besseyi]KAI6185779.1 N-acetylgalactosaminide beta-1,3-galactosyltransferase [Aphelenchoides besseyi]
MRRKQPLLFFILGASMCFFVFLNLPFFFDLDTIVNSLRYFEAYKYQDVDYEEMAYSKQEVEESFVARELKQNVRILCWIMSGPGNTKKAMAVNATWAPKCNKYFFVTADNGLPSVDFNVSAGRDHLWEKTQRAFKYLYETELNNYDWFLKADDDTFVIMENLRFMLLAYSPDDPIWFGCKLKPQVRHGYMSGGAGYVLSRKALKRFVEEALNNTEQCRPNDAKDEDVYVGKCLESVHVVAGDSRDIHGNHRMLPLEPALHFDLDETKKSDHLKWFHSNIFYPYDRFKAPLSEYVISFHYIGNGQMLALYNQFYNMRVFGISDGLERLAKPEDGEKMIDAFRLLSQNSSRSFDNMIDERVRTQLAGRSG